MKYTEKQLKKNSPKKQLQLNATPCYINVIIARSNPFLITF